MGTDTSSAADQTKRISSFISETEYDDISPAVVDHATKMIVDSMAVTLAGADSDPTAVISDVYGETYHQNVEQGDPEGKSRIPGVGDTATPREAAFLIGIMGHSLDFDDIHETIGGHPSTPVLSALLPVAEREGVTGQDLLRSFVLGAEVEVVLAEVLNPGLYDRGWHPTAIFGTMGAAAAVSDLLGLETNEIRMALGIAASMASGIKGNFGTMTKSLHVGEAARNGQMAAELAAGGFSANTEILELDFGGYCDLFKGETGFDFDTHIDRLGSPWGILDPPVGFKPYPCCGSTHSAIDAALAIREEAGFTVDDISEIHVREHPRRLGHTDDPKPETPLDAKFSVQYVIAVALVEGDLWLEHFDENAVSDEIYRSLLQKVNVVRDAAAFEDKEWGAELTVVTQRETYTKTIDAPKGSNERPLSDSELEEKYRRCATTQLDDQAVNQSLRHLQNLDSVEDVGQVLETLT